MENPSYYKNVNVCQKQDLLNTLEKYKTIINWCPHGDDKILDIGCGPGDLTIECILPILPKQFKKLDAIDISKNMIDYAQEGNLHPKVQFKIMDFSLPIPDNPSEKYDHIFSNYCLNWIQNQELALRNIYNLLHSNGDCLLVIAIELPSYGVYSKAKESLRFAEYCYDAELYISPYYQKQNSKAFIENLLHTIGFSGYLVEIVDVSLELDIKLLKNIFEGVDPFIKRMPKNLHEAYLDFFLETSLKNGYIKEITDKNLMIWDRKYASIYARK